MAFIAGRVSLAVGDDHGGLHVWFPVRDSADLGPGDADGPRLWATSKAAVTTLASSGRSRLLMAGYRDGTVRLYHVTSHRFLGESSLEEGPVIVGGHRSPGRPAAGGQRRPAAWSGSWTPPTRTSASAPWCAPSGTRAIPAPAYVWQSSAATDTFEPKLSLIPLIYGTLKATFYSMLFGLPLALLAALYTSEFLNRGPAPGSSL